MSDQWSGDDNRDELGTPAEYRDYGLDCPDCGAPDGYACEDDCRCFYCIRREPSEPSDAEREARDAAPSIDEQYAAAVAQRENWRR